MLQLSCDNNAATILAVQRSELLRVKGQLHAVEAAVAEERVALSSQHQSHYEKLVRSLPERFFTSILHGSNTELCSEHCSAVGPNRFSMTGNAI